MAAGISAAIFFCKSVALKGEPFFQFNLILTIADNENLKQVIDSSNKYLSREY